MTTIQAQIPDYLYKQVDAMAQPLLRRIAKKEGISIDMIISMALSGHIATLLPQPYLTGKAERGSWQRFQNVLAKVPDVEPDAFDRVD